MNTWKLIVGFVICCCTGSVSAQQANFVQAEKFRQPSALSRRVIQIIQRQSGIRGIPLFW